jgi:hypothetical protein
LDDSSREKAGSDLLVDKASELFSELIILCIKIEMLNAQDSGGRLRLLWQYSKAVHGDLVIGGCEFNPSFF